MFLCFCLFIEISVVKAVTPQITIQVLLHMLKVYTYIYYYYININNMIKHLSSSISRIEISLNT